MGMLSPCSISFCPASPLARVPRDCHLLSLGSGLFSRFSFATLLISLHQPLDGPPTVIMAAVISVAFHSILARNLYISFDITLSTLACVVVIILLTRPTCGCSTDHSPKMSPDTVSSLFPDRPIRPMPRRRLREKLSPEAADSIEYPPSTHDNVHLFYYPYTFKDEDSLSSDSYSSLPAPGRNYTSRRNGTYHEEEDAALRSTLVPRSPPDILNRAGNGPSRPEQPRRADPQPPPSTTSSVDGYDSFENVSNKKKRKIPSAGDSALNGTHALNSEIGSLAISVGTQSPGDVNGDRPSAYPGSGTFVPVGQGISGSGRGRLGMSRNGRSPLRALADGNNSWAPRTPKQGPSQWTQSGTCSHFFNSLRCSTATISMRLRGRLELRYASLSFSLCNRLSCSLRIANPFTFSPTKSTGCQPTSPIYSIPSVDSFLPPALQEPKISVFVLTWLFSLN